MSIKDWPAGIINKTAVTPAGNYENSAASGVWSMDKVAYWVKQGLWPIPGNAMITTDSYFKYVSLLLSGDGTNGAQNNTFLDSSTNNFTITRNGNTTQGTFSPYGNLWSNYFPSGANYLSSASNLTLAGDFTLEAWVYRESTASNGCILQIGSEGSGRIIFYLNGSNQLAYDIYSVGSSVLGSGVALNQWNHIAIVRSGTTLKGFVNGVAGSTATRSGTLGNATQFSVGNSPNGSNAMIGYMSNVRLVNGTALYTSDFTPSTAPLTAFPGTSLLTCQSSQFKDSSINSFALTVSGTPKVQRFSPFNPASTYTTGSVYFDGTGDRLITASNSSLALNSNDFTIECWCNFISGTSNELRFIWNNYNSWTAQSIFFGKHTATSGAVSIWVNNYSTGAPLLTDPTLPPNNQWVHYALVRNGSTWTLYRDGFSVATATYAGVASTNTISQIGGNDESTSYTMYGYISDFRLVNGTAVYTSNFTRPSAPLTAIANTKLLTCQSTQFVDASTNGLTITTTGNPSISTITPFNSASGYNSLGTTTGSGYFTSGSYLTVPDSTALNLSGGAYTIEGWIWPTGEYSNYRTIIAKRILGGATTAWEVYLRTSTGVLGFYNGTNYESSVTPSANQWNHFAAVYDGTNINLYLNGTRVLQSAVSNVDRATPVYIGTFPTYDEQYLGYMSNLRVVKGTALYSGTTLVVPTSPLTAISGTSLLVNFANAGIPDISMQNVFQTVGNVQVSTSVKKYGTGSLYFDGTGDYLNSVAAPSAIQGSEPFTIEAWIYPTSVTGRDFCIYETRGGTGWVFFINSSGKLQAYDSVAGLLTQSNDTISINTWTHVALVRQSGSSSVTYYVNGTASGTFTLASFAAATQVRVGARSDAAEAFVGYIDDLRVTKGYARYTTGFTPPTKAFSTQ